VFERFDDSKFPWNLVGGELFATVPRELGSLGGLRRIDERYFRTRNLAEMSVFDREYTALSRTASTSSPKNFIPAMQMRLARRPTRYRSPSESNQP
jgi:hypothetical protein